MARGNTKINAIHKMVEALIQEENDEAIAALQTYLRLKTRSILGEEDESETEEVDTEETSDDEGSDDDSDSDDDGDDESDDDESDDDDSDDDDDEGDDDSSDDGDDEEMEYEEDEEKSKKKKKKMKMKEGKQWLETPPTPKRDFYGWKPVHAAENAKKGKAQEYHSNGKQAPKGDSQTAKPHKKNDTESRKQEFKGNDAKELGRSVKDNNQSDHRRGQRSNRT